MYLLRTLLFYALGVSCLGTTTVGADEVNTTTPNTERAAILALRSEAIQATHRAIVELRTKAGGWSGWNDTLAPFRADIEGRCAEATARGEAYLVGPTQSIFTVALTEYAIDQAMPVGEDGEAEIRETSAYKTISQLHQDLAARSIDLIFVPIPQKEEVYPQSLSALAPTEIPLYPQRYRYMEALLEGGVEVVDLLPNFLAYTAANEDALYPKTDLHWNSRAMALAAKELAARLQRYPFAHTDGPNPYTAAPVRIDVQGPLVKYFIPLEQQAAHENLVDEGLQVFQPDGSIYEYDSIDDGPVLMIGDSFMMRSRSGGSWAARLAYEMGIPVTGFMQEQKGAQSAARILARKGPTFYKERRVVVLYVVGGMLSRLWYVQELGE